MEENTGPDMDVLLEAFADGLPYRDILGNARYGSEIWGGGRGLHVSLVVNGAHR